MHVYIVGVSAGNPFTGLDVIDGMNVGYYITSDAGEYGAQWDDRGGPWAATTIIFR